MTLYRIYHNDGTEMQGETRKMVSTEEEAIEFIKNYNIETYEEEGWDDAPTDPNDDYFFEDYAYEAIEV